MASRPASDTLCTWGLHQQEPRSLNISKEFILVPHSSQSTFGYCMKFYAAAHKHAFPDHYSPITTGSRTFTTASPDSPHSHMFSVNLLCCVTRTGQQWLAVMSIELHSAQVKLEANKPSSWSLSLTAWPFSMALWLPACPLCPKEQVPIIKHTRTPTLFHLSL